MVDNLLEHCKRMAKQVAEWPEWKRRASPYNEYIPMTDNLKIVGVAFRRDGMVVVLPRPNRHCHLFSVLYPIFHPMNISLQSFEQGFVTSNGEFATREEAWKIAERVDQILPDENRSYSGTLYSEDLW